METGDLSLNELMNQYNSIEKTDNNNILLSSPVTVKPWYITYMLYIGLFVWTIIFVIVAKPSIMYVTDPETKEKKLKFSKVLLTIVIIFVSLSATVFGINYFNNK